MVLAVLAMSNSSRTSSNCYETTEIELCRTGQFGFHFPIENLQQRRFARTGAAHDCIQCSKLKLSAEIP
ncbi:hypothetical protein DERF_010485 [Dermatophagoides farinae]|uniref:Uncharacterized protein n=1 Tax=Dermatophagoides farinae TaxID=6954 RepID=A0A922L6Z4_DERFA|nr:hypothetical protein DERF_010485 [Dermatophagoides farinae]